VLSDALNDTAHLGLTASNLPQQAILEFVRAMCA